MRSTTSATCTGCLWLDRSWCWLRPIFTRYDGWVMALLAWSCMGLAPAAARPACARGASGWRALCWWPRRWPGSFTTPLALATGSTLRAGRIRPRRSRCAQLRRAQVRRIRAGTIRGSRCSSLSKVAEMDAAAAAWGNVLLVVSLLGTAWAWLTARRRAFSLGAAALVSGSLLCVFGGLWIGADLSARRGGRTPGTTRATEWRCCRPLRWGWVLLRTVRAGRGA